MLVSTLGLVPLQLPQKYTQAAKSERCQHYGLISERRVLFYQTILSHSSTLVRGELHRTLTLQFLPLLRLLETEALPMPTILSHPYYDLSVCWNRNESATSSDWNMISN